MDLPTKEEAQEELALVLSELFEIEARRAELDAERRGLDGMAAPLRSKRDVLEKLLKKVYGGAA